MYDYKLTHLKQLEAENIHVIREVAAEFEKTVRRGHEYQSVCS